MIRSLRTTHRTLFIIIAPILVGLFIVALQSRKPEPTMTSLPKALTGNWSDWNRVLWENSDFTESTPIRARVLADRDPPLRMVLELRPGMDPKRPDVLIYWVEGVMTPDLAIPDNAQLLGNLAGSEVRFFLLPIETGQSDQSIVLYSLAHHRTVAVGQLPKFSN